MTAIIVNSYGVKEVDPHNIRNSHERWLKKITESGAIDYHSCKDVSPEGSEYITKYILEYKNLTNQHELKRGDLNL